MRCRPAPRLSGAVAVDFHEQGSISVRRLPSSLNPRACYGFGERRRGGRCPPTGGRWPFLGPVAGMSSRVYCRLPVPRRGEHRQHARRVSLPPPACGRYGGANGRPGKPLAQSGQHDRRGRVEAMTVLFVVFGSRRSNIPRCV